MNKISMIQCSMLLLTGFLLWVNPREVEGGATSAELQKHVMFLTPPAFSHMNILRELAVGFAEEFGQHYRVSLGTTGKYVKTVESTTTGIQVINVSSSGAAECGDISAIPGMRENNLVNDPVERVRGIGSLVKMLFDCQFDRLEALFLDPATRPDLLVLDFFEFPAFTLADKLGIDYVIVGSLGVAGFEEQFWLPNGLVGVPLLQMRSIASRWKNLYELGRLMLAFGSIVQQLNEPLLQRGLPPSTGLTNSWANHLVIIPESWMFHHARPVNPNAQLIGFLSPPIDSVRAAGGQIKAQDAALFAWLDDLQAADSEALVFYVAFGSHLAVPQHVFELLVKGLLSADPRVHVLVGIREDVTINSEGLLTAQEMRRFRREQWMPQVRVLAHPAVKVFVSHGGLSSVAESVQAEVPLLVVPFFADQPKNAFQLQDAGVALAYLPQQLTLPQVVAAAQQLLANYSSFKANIHKLHLISEFAGGRKTAARLIDAQVRFGSDHLVSVERHFTYIERHNLDIIAIAAVLVLVIVLLLIYLLVKLTRFLFCRHRSKSSSTSPKSSSTSPKSSSTPVSSSSSKSHVE